MATQTVDTRPQYEAPKITPMDRDEILQSFQMTAAQISAAGCRLHTGMRGIPVCSRQPDVRGAWRCGWETQLGRRWSPTEFGRSRNWGGRHAEVDC